MSLLNLSFLKRKTTSYDDSAGPFCGYVLEENSVQSKHESLMHCLVKGLFIFAASFGCISGVLSEFDIAYNYVAVLGFIFITSMALSLIHLNKFLFNVGYPLIFITFATMLIRYRAYANSGFQALINIINEEYSSHFLMLFTRESTETITDRYLTITAAAIFLGIFMAILINVGIFNEMYFMTTFNLTFWPLQLGIYIGKYPSFISLVLLFFSYFGIYFLKHSNHYHYIYPGKKRTPTKTYHYKGLKYVHSKSNARSMIQLCALALVISLFFSAFGTATAVGSESDGNTNSPLKESVDPYVKIFVQNGLSGFFNRYQATGGLSNGRLGGINSVRPDYQTDLIVTFVPYAYETLYLKAFVGAEYTGSQWNKPGSSTTPYQYPIVEDYSFYHEYCTYVESFTLSAMMEEGEIPAMSGTMMIENIDAASNYLYLPYYTLPIAEHTSATKENTVLGAMPLSGGTITLNYIPYSQSQADLDTRTVSDFSVFRDSEYTDAFMTYRDECYDNYLQIPGDIAPVLIQYQEKIGTSDNLETQIELIRQFLTANYTYDMAPGTTPRNEDFVLYFLEEQKKGYCSHFASAATLLFRSYGIPARYVEGYVVSQLAISDRAQATEYKYEDFFEGENILGAENVVEVEVNDGDAHAWVEIFIDGFGWMPVEVTPPSDDIEEPTYNDFLSALTGLLGGEGDTTQNTTDGTGTGYDALFETLQFRTSPVVSLFLFVLALALAFPLLAKCVRSCKTSVARKHDYQNGIYDSTISYEYRRLYNRLKKKYPDRALQLPEDTAELLTEILTDYDKTQWQDNEITDLIGLTEKSCFSGKQVSKETADMLIAFYRYSCKRCTKTFKLM